jgi:hypothetical protein
MNDYLNFRKMITPLIIQIIFWVGVAACLISGLIQIAGGFGRYGNGGLIFMGLLTIILGPIVIRIYCELIILLFRIYDTLVDLKGLLTKQ